MELEWFFFFCLVSKKNEMNYNKMVLKQLEMDVKK